MGLEPQKWLSLLLKQLELYQGENPSYVILSMEEVCQLTVQRKRLCLVVKDVGINLRYLQLMRATMVYVGAL